MSVHVSSWAWQQEVGDDGAKLVLLKLADSANDDGVSFPGKDRVLVECEVGHDDTLKRRLRRLRDLELVIPIPWLGGDGRQTYSTYVLPFKGVPSAERLWQLIEKAPRRGAPAVTRDELYAAEAVGSFLRSGGATVHPLDLASGGAAEYPPRGAHMHPPIEDSFVGTSTEEANASPVPDGPGELARRKHEIRWALTEAVGAKPVTRAEHGRWGAAISDLAEAGATGTEVRERCAWWRENWPNVVLAPNGLVANWSLLGAQLANAKPDGFEAWLQLAPSRFVRDDAHLVIDDARIDDAERARRHRLIDERFNIDDERSNAA